MVGRWATHWCSSDGILILSLESSDASGRILLEFPSEEDWRVKEKISRETRRPLKATSVIDTEDKRDQSSNAYKVP